MKSLLNLTAVAAAAASFPLLAQGAVVTNTNTLPANTVIDLTGFPSVGTGTGVQARWRNGGGDVRGAVQTLTWNTTDALSAYGLQFDESQGSFDPFNQSHQYVIDVQLLNTTGTLDAVVSTVASETITIEAADVAPSGSGSPSYLLIDFDADIPLVQGESYAFHLYPAAAQPNPVNQRLYFAQTDTSNPYAGGFGNQTNAAPRATGGDFGRQDYELGAFAVAVPEPTSLALVGIGGLALLQRRRARG